MDGGTGRGAEEDEGSAGGCHTSHLQRRPLLQDGALEEGVCGKVEVDPRNNVHFFFCFAATEI